MARVIEEPEFYIAIAPDRRLSMGAFGMRRSRQIFFQVSGRSQLAEYRSQQSAAQREM